MAASPRRPTTAIERILSRSRVDESTGCLVFTGLLNDGYGYISDRGTMRYVHRIVFEQSRGPIPEGFEPDHLCRNRACFNVDHLELVTKRENILRGDGPPAQNARKTLCCRGHELSRLSNGHRVCVSCRRVSGLRWARENSDQARAYYRENAERIKARVRARYRAKREEINAARRAEYARRAA
jgi:hypothetical protein